jgi:type II secretory ATPase GspE/PulE/Tfp pilus assembly ATPase PilB-like protein
MRLRNFEDGQLLAILTQGNYVSAEDAKKAEAFAKEHRGSAVDYLLSEDLLTKDLVGQAVAEHLKVPFADLNSRRPSAELAKVLPDDVAIEHRLIPYNDSGKVLTIATDDIEGSQSIVKEIAKQIKNRQIQIAYAPTDDINDALSLYRKKLDTRFSKIIESTKRVAPEVITEIIEDALAFRASDVHFEPQEADVLIRFRIDGIMEDAGRIPRQYYDNMLNRIKVLARMRIDEHFAAQDGAIRYENEAQVTDMRVSIVPTVNGEKIVLRLLSDAARGFTLADIGMNEAHEKQLQVAFSKPFGMILVTGPTGSGKTTTLYAVLKRLNSPTLNITTIEDPVEYKITGINQIQVNHETNLTFSKGLRSIVRQDPDVILVGEIRDQETAEIGVNAALTGHLLLSTFHSNDAPTAIPRLIDMGVEPFLLASTLEAIIGQRLVRRICAECRTSDETTNTAIIQKYPELKPYFKDRSITLYYGKGCDACHHTGYRGRIAIMEFIEITNELEDLILKHPSAADVWTVARQGGATTLFEDGIEKIKEGVTTIDEVLRVAEPPSRM